MTRRAAFPAAEALLFPLFDMPGAATALFTADDIEQESDSARIVAGGSFIDSPDALRVIEGDCLDVLALMPGEYVAAIVTDPPYGLGFMGKHWDTLPPGLPWARECLRVLKPGGHLLAFGGTRTSHRLAVAVEDAGFEIRDSIAWLYGSGFPKSLDVSKAIDARGGNPGLSHEIGAAIKAARISHGYSVGDADRQFCGGSTNWSWFEGRKAGCRAPTPDVFDRIVEAWPELAPFAALVAAAYRETIGTGLSGIGTAFGDGQWAQGAVQVFDVTAPATDDAKAWAGWGTALKPAFEPIIVARKPFVGTVAANVLAHGTGALHIDACRVHALDALAGRTRHGGGVVGNGSSYEMPDSHGEQSAGRWPTNVLLDEGQAAALDEQTGTLTSGTRKAGTYAGLGYQGSDSAAFPAVQGNEGGASRFFPTFRYQAKAPGSERPKVDGTAHPTVKPLALMRWLVRLVAAPGALILDPFAGSGTTLQAAALEGMRSIGIERETQYLQLIAARLGLDELKVYQ